MVGNKNNNPLIIYYGFSTDHRPEHEQVLLDLAPKPLLNKLIKDRVKENNNYRIDYQSMGIGSPGYHACTALHELVDSTYFINSPIDADVFFNDDGLIMPNIGKNYGVFMPRMPSFNNCFSADLFYDMLLFCEESIEVKFTPPYMDKPVLSDYGYASASQLNIGKWFRPLPIVFHLWPNIKQLSLKEGEPLMYIHFDNPEKRKIILKEFKMDDELVKISDACIKNKDIFPFETMSKIYSRFTNTSMRARTLAAIKNNIIE